MTRAKARWARQGAWHRQRIATADTARTRLSAACQYLVAEAARAGVIDEETTRILARVEEIRNLNRPASGEEPR